MPTGKTGFIFNLNAFQCKHVCSKSTFEWIFSSYVFDKCFWHFRELKTDCWTSRNLLCEKIWNYFVCVNVRILVEMWNIYESHIFQMSLVQTWWLETTFFVFKNPLKYKIFSKLSLSLGNRFTLCAHPLITSIIIHIRTPNAQENVSYVLGFMFQLKFTIRI